MRGSITILGTSSAAPTKDRFHSGQYFTFLRDVVLIDCGEGTQYRLLQYGLNYQKINHIFISHLHGDHYLGLPGLINTMALNSRSKPLTVYGPSGLSTILDAHFSSGKSHLSFDLTVEELQAGERIELKSMTCEVVQLEHRIPCYGFRFVQNQSDRKLNIARCEELNIPVSVYSLLKEGADYSDEHRQIGNVELTFPSDKPFSYGYMTDTRYLPELSEVFAETDVLYHEATYLSTLIDRAEATFHSTAQQAGMFARLSAVNQLIIGHFSSRYDDLKPLLEEARSEFPNTELAVEAKTFEIS